MPPEFLKSAPGEDPIITKADFAASPARIFRAFTEPDEIRQWFGGGPDRVVNADIDLRVGGAWRFAFNDTPGSVNALYGAYIEIVPDQRLVFSWIHQQAIEDGSMEETAPSQVTVDLAPRGTGTRLSVRHEGIVRESGRLGVGEGWSYGLSSLMTMLRTEERDQLGTVS